MDIWHTASQSNEYLNTGWLGRYLDAQCNGCDKPTQALEMDDVLSLALKRRNIKRTCLERSAAFVWHSNEKFFKDVSQTSQR